VVQIWTTNIPHTSLEHQNTACLHVY
jgi:hypothetical protein